MVRFWSLEENEDGSRVWDFPTSVKHIELPAKLLDFFLRSDKSNINQVPSNMRSRR